MVTRLQEETREQAIARLAQKARESGVAIRRDHTGRYFVSSASQRGSWHYCTAVSCDCKGFAMHGRCMHHSLLLVHLGWADEDPTPEPKSTSLQSEVEQPAPCRFCDGQGSTPSTELFGGRRMDIAVTCWHCWGTGQAAAA